MTERQRDTTSECDDTDTGSELGTSPPHDTLPGLDNALPGLDNTRDSSSVSDNTLEERGDTVTADDSLLSVSGSVRHADDAAASNVDEDEIMSRSAPAAFNNTRWSVRGSAYSALTWMSGVVSRSFVHPVGEEITEGQPAAEDDDAEVNDAAAESDVAAVTSDVNDEEAESVTAEADGVNSSLMDTVSAYPNVTVTDISDSLAAHQSPADTFSDTLSACQPTAPPSDTAGEVSVSADANVTLTDVSDSLAAHQSPADTFSDTLSACQPTAPPSDTAGEVSLSADANVTLTDVSDTLSACQPTAPPSDSALGIVTCDTTDSVTQYDIIHDMATGRIYHCLQPDDTALRYCIYLHIYGYPVA